MCCDQSLLCIYDIIINWYLYFFPIFYLWFLTYGGHIVYGDLPVGDMTLRPNLQDHDIATFVSTAFSVIWAILLLFVFGISKIQSKLLNNTFIAITIVFIILLIYSYYAPSNQIVLIIQIVSISIFLFIPSAMTLRAITIYQKLSEQHVMFTNEAYNPREYRDFWAILKWVLFIVYNVSVVSWCFIKFGEECNLEAIYAIGPWLNWCWLLHWPYYFIPRNLKYDLYHLKKELFWSSTLMIFRHLMDSVWSFKIKYVVQSDWSDIHDSIGLCIAFVTFSVYLWVPWYYEYKKQSKFESLNVTLRWNEYMRLSQSDGINFLNYVKALNVGTNMPFIVELMIYKQALIDRLRLNNKYCGYFINFDNQHIFRIISYNLDDDNWSTARIDQDLMSLWHNVFENGRRMNLVSRSSYQCTNQIRNKLDEMGVSEDDYAQIFECNDKNASIYKIIKMYDSGVKEVDDAFQRLYREYQLENATQNDFNYYQ